LAELLRDGEFQRARCRLLCASRFDTDSIQRESKLRVELFYRISVISIAVPSLRERPEDVLVYADRFLADAAAQLRKDVRSFSPSARRLIQAYSWPGNLHELRASIEHGVAVASGPRIEATELPLAVRQLPQTTVPSLLTTLPEEGIDLRTTLDALENTLLQQALERTGWNKQRAAALLGLNRTTLVEMLKRKRMQRPSEPPVALTALAQDAL
jgi:DNA-binding NtrC family response regulator